jgi:hypothetical protein
MPWVPGEAVELHEVVDLLLGGSEQGRVRGVLGTAGLKMVHRQPFGNICAEDQIIFCRRQQNFKGCF